MIELRLPNSLVQLSGDLPASVCDALSDLEDGRLHVDPGASRCSVAVTENGGTWSVRTDAIADRLGFGVVGVASDADDLLDVLVSRLNRLAFGADPHRLHLHAACVEVDGVGVVLGGASGSGKSTVTTALLRRGAHYLTDENLTLLPGSRTVFAYPKPITLKTGSLDWLAGRAADTQRSTHPAVLTAGLPSPSSRGRAHLRASSIGPATPFSVVGVVVFPRHESGDGPTLRQLPLAEACARLLSDSLDAVRMGPTALDALASVVSGATAWELTYDDADAAAEIIAELRPALRRRVLVSHRLEADPRVASATATATATATKRSNALESDDTALHAVRFDDSTVLYDGATRALLELSSSEADTIEGIGRVDGRRESDRLAGLGVPVRARRSSDARVGAIEFGLPNVPIGGLTDALPITDEDVHGGTVGRCTGVVAAQLVRGRPAAEAVAAAAMERHREGQATCLLLERELPRLVDLLEGSGARPVVLKGPVSAHDTPAPPYLRDFGDLDLLIPGSQMSLAVRTLSSAGFERTFRQVSPEFDRRFTKSITMRGVFGAANDSATFELDLHRTLTPGPFGMFVDLDDLHARAIPFSVDGRWYRALHPDHRFLHACLHVVLGSAEPRLNSLRDLIVSAPRSPDAVASTFESARRWRMTSVLFRAIDLAQQLSSTSLSTDLIRLSRREPAPRTERLYLSSYHRPGMSYALPAVATTFALPGLRAKMSYIAAQRRHRSS